MPQSRAEPKPKTGYLYWSRDPAVGLFAVAPLWITYEILRLSLAPAERNGAEVLMLEGLRWLGPAAAWLARATVLLTVCVAAWSIHRRQVPWARVGMVSALEGAVYGLVLGPLAALLAASTYRVLALPGPAGLPADLVGSLGAGIFEELFFRLLLLSLLALLLTRACAAFGLPRALGVAVAVLLSALLFALFHHLGPGAPPIEAGVFLFRASAGLLLGGLFVLRGFSVCVFTHTVYDLHYYLTHAT